ncbi:MAG: hypothetical protein ACREGB_03345 [Candidatus Saccharimonadales bacterium]
MVTNADGELEITTTTTNEDGSGEIIHPDGSVTTINADGTTTTEE